MEQVVRAGPGLRHGINETQRFETHITKASQMEIDILQFSNCGDEKVHGCGDSQLRNRGPGQRVHGTIYLSWTRTLARATASSRYSVERRSIEGSKTTRIGHGGFGTSGRRNASGMVKGRESDGKMAASGLSHRSEPHDVAAKLGISNTSPGQNCRQAGVADESCASTGQISFLSASYRKRGSSVHPFSAQ
jgi:hypothetical protein